MTNSMLSLDIVVPTHNRVVLLDRLLSSLASLDLPERTAVRLIVVANACVDSTVAHVRDRAATFPFPLVAIEEPRPGKSQALNTGVKSSTAEWVAFFDDDETVHADWLRRFCELLGEQSFDFAAGIYLPEFEEAPPSWMPQRHTATVISRHGELPRQPLGPNSAIMWGGNCVIKRAALESVGGFSEQHSRSGLGRALGCEDVDMQLRLLEHGYVGHFFPELRINHWTPKERLSKSFFRHKVYWAAYNSVHYHHGREKQSDRRGHRAIARVFGIERWRLRQLGRSFSNLLLSSIGGRAARTMEAQLDIIDFAGYAKATMEIARTTARGNP